MENSTIIVVETVVVVFVMVVVLETKINSQFYPTLYEHLLRRNSFGKKFKAKL